MTSWIDINGLKVFARIGVLESERTVGNRFQLDIRLNYDASAAVASDSIDDAVNYAAVAAVAVDTLTARPMQLIEYAAGQVRDAIRADFPAVCGGRVTLTKLHPPIPAPTPTVSFTIEW